jgi:hypothetical protein
MKRILITGDTHGRWNYLNDLIGTMEPDETWVCGDFGYWPNIHPMFDNVHGGIVRWCDGNHEDHMELRNLENAEIAPNVFYMPRGSHITLDDGRNVLFFGGGYSIDRHLRGKYSPDFGWFPQEEASVNDMYNIDADLEDVDVVISHTCPLEVMETFVPYDRGYGHYASEYTMSRIFEMFQPKEWYFGHWHRNKTGNHLGCQWTCLTDAPYGGWHTWLT